MPDSDEELSPSLENFIVLTWLRLIHSDLPGLVKQRYGTKLRSQTLASIKPEISQALDSLLDEIASTNESKVLRTTLHQSTIKVTMLFVQEVMKNILCVRYVSRLIGQIFNNVSANANTYLKRISVTSDRKFVRRFAKKWILILNKKQTYMNMIKTKPLMWFLLQGESLQNNNHI